MTHLLRHHLLRHHLLRHHLLRDHLLRHRAPRRHRLTRQRLVLVSSVAVATATAAALGAACEHLGGPVSIPQAAFVGACLSLDITRRAQAAHQRRAHSIYELMISCLSISAVLTVLGLSVLVPAAVSTAAVYAVLLQPTRRRLIECMIFALATSTAALGAQGLGWTAALVPFPAAFVVAAVLLFLTAPTIANATDLALRAQQAAAALEAERSSHLAVLERAALHDPLTGLLGRRGLDGPLHQAAATAAPGALTAVLFVDLDGFKPINDLHGHAAGDELLTVVAQRLLACARDSDVVARTGGDEFVLVLPGLPHLQAAHKAADRIRAAVVADVHLMDGATVTVGASVGVAATARPCDAEDLLHTADQAMYEAKQKNPTRPTR